MDVNVSKVGLTFADYKANRSAPVKNEKIVPRGDSVTVSGMAVDYQTARKALEQVPDVRDEKVRAAVSKIVSGTFETNASAIAEKLFSQNSILESLQRDLAV